MTKTISTCDFCDQQIEAIAAGSVRVLPPQFKNFGRLLAFHGQVSTVRCHEDNSQVRAALETAGMARVLVVDGGGSMRHALFGGNLAALAARNGWAGVVIDGCVRDVAEIAAAPIGVRALACMPMPPSKLGEGSRDVAVRIQGVWVRPGDWLYADVDGMLVSTQALHLATASTSA
ncbi:MAG: ribonuclease E activity regulator RraA [Betaproteobacteria bacterium]|jgi:regulator of ribonuclease activity A|uniref:ribonuclease E activity regulator RraA n=1 Tax=Thiomonas sp. TaxID=2047785 RepID=UPI000BC956E6|nr:ribonuclease E activity regulator RraA [Thiomonas sp.]MDE2128367.1 ribonuclease E activity regulator RraA [Betaproteobacteria bacterium]OZB46123.1 MAG: ribonuclease [Thiomonas sp. 15-66-11]